MSEKIYVGNGKEVKFSDGGSKIRFTITLDGMKELWEQYGFTAKNSGKKMIKLEMSRRREPDEWENTHYVTVDTWKPDTGQSAPPAEDDNIPF